MTGLIKLKQILANDFVALAAFSTSIVLQFINSVTPFVQFIALIAGVLVALLKIVYQIDYYLLYRKEFRKSSQKAKELKQKVAQFKTHNYREEII